MACKTSLLLKGQKKLFIEVLQLWVLYLELRLVLNYFLWMVLGMNQVLFVYLAYEQPAILTPLDKKIFVSSLNYLCTFIKNQMSIYEVTLFLDFLFCSLDLLVDFDASSMLLETVGLKYLKALAGWLYLLKYGPVYHKGFRIHPQSRHVQEEAR